MNGGGPRRVGALGSFEAERRSRFDGASVEQARVAWFFAPVRQSGVARYSGLAASMEGVVPMRQTTIITTREQHERSWHIVDASGKRLGRLAAEVSQVLMGKHRPDYTAHIDTGDYVIIINCSKVMMTGKKTVNRVKTRYSGYPGGLRTETYGELLGRKPDFVVEDAIRRMLPKGMLGKAMLKKLKTYPDAEHPHEAQRPAPLAV